MNFYLAVWLVGTVIFLGIPVALAWEPALREKSWLITFWRLEALWQRRAPRSHTAFRRAYNRVGPVVAGRIGGRTPSGRPSSPWNGPRGWR